ncbi:S8 family serine peptidase [Roseovarius aestuariivivens]|uniref:S8 family serine peptidase n=1 Tax=Roseovarius aestuariivivens TaxID=1888910 RepID=UPI001436BA68|nr:S8 family serine peptidase [Roseovarius aestuariivivens]
MPRDLYARLNQGLPIPDEDALVIELVFDTPRSPENVAAQLAGILPDASAEVTSAFEQPEDLFHFIRFFGTTGQGDEALAFAFARALRPEMGAVEANPVLTDSLYGAYAVGATDTESLGLSCSTPRDDSLPWGWVHTRIGTRAAWSKHTRGSGSTVAVIDTGYSNHQELTGAIRSQGQRNFVEGGSDARDRFSTGILKHPGHGTLVCSVIASRGTVDAQGNVTSGGGITGSAPEATILPIRAIKSVIDATQNRIAPAIAHAINQGADVIAMALGGPTRVAATEAAMRQAVAHGRIVVCAAGNCWPRVVFPAAYASRGLCTAVAALNPDLTPWAKTGSGPEVTVSNYGVHVWGAAKNKASDPDHGIRPAQGTTLATSLTAGAAALWVARHGGRAALKNKADAAGTTVQAMFVHCLTRGLTRPPAWGGSGALGAGVVDVDRLLDAPLPSGAEAPAPAEPGPTGATPSLAVLQDHLAGHDPAAAAELDSDLADYAAELIWLSHRAQARVRAAESLTTEAVAAPDAASDALAARLTEKPALRAALRRP